MSNDLIQKLANKFIENYFSPELLAQQKEKLEDFYYDATRRLKNVINEMSGDLLTLKEKNFAPELRQLLGKVYQQIIDLYKDIDPKEPYSGVLSLISWANAKNNKSILDNLDFLIQRHLEKHEENFYGKNKLHQPSVSSINKFVNLIQDLKDYMINNPMVEDRALSELEQLDKGPISSSIEETKSI